MPRSARRICWTLLIAVLTLAAAATVQALVVPDGSSPAAEKSFRHPDLSLDVALVPARQLPALAAAQALADLAQLGVKVEESQFDARGGTWGRLLPSTPVLPGNGPGNDLTWPDFGRSGPPADLRRDAWNAFEAYLALNQGALRIDVAELARPGRVTVHNDGELIQVFAPRVIDGILVRDSYLVGTISHGNLILFGAHHWGPAAVSTEPRLSAEDASAVVDDHLGSLAADGVWRRPHLVIVPTRPGNGLAAGKAYRYRLAWVISPRFAGDYGRYEGLVDAADGTLLSFEDTNHYATTRRVLGGVYPESNDGLGTEGVEQAGWPMPFADLSTAACGNGVCEPGSGENCVNCAADCRGVQSGNPNNRYCCGDGGGQNPVGCTDSRCTSAGFQCSNSAASTIFTDAGGNALSCFDGSVSTRLAGQFMRMNDNCGAINESSTGDINLGTSGGIDCTVPAGHSAGDTHASRSGFYEMNRIKEMARGQLPGNAWLKEQLLANMNINLTCNAFWSGVDVNFYRSGGGCNNTGELAGVFDHEWGHGLDDNDTNGIISNPGEGIADVYAALRLNKSCLGRGFLSGSACGGYGDPCVGSPPCDGVRDIDFAKHASNTPVDINWLNSHCPSGGAPCGREVHCAGLIYAEAVWDLFNRDLAGTLNTKLEIATRLTYLGAANVGDWYQCVQGSGGCPAGSGYMQYLAADDDDANLSNGTPHMTAIFNAFNRHGIACTTPTVQNSGCSGAPTTAPSVTGTAIDRGAKLSWGSVTGATKYQVFRTDGVFGCNYGKTKVGETSGTSFTDSGLQNGRSYFYTVVPVGSHNTCMGPASTCTTVVPASGPNLGIGTGTVSITSGDGDPFLDNCETATVSFPVSNIGNATQTNVRIVSVTPSNGGVSVLSTLPKSVSASLAACGSANGSVDIRAGGLATNETLTLTVGVTSDQLNAQGVTKTRSYTVQFTESNLQNFASRNFNFEASTEGWNVVQGTFNRTNSGGGGNGTSWYEASSANLPDQCDQIRSPVVSLTSTSTMSLWNQFAIEGVFQGSTWYDRANVGLYDPATSSRTAVSPSGGRLYNASGANGTCGTTGQAGWAGSNTTWGTSTWSATALGSAANAGQLRQLEVRYGTDELSQGFGFHFDEVTLTNVNVQVADTQSNTCGSPPVCGDAVCNGTETQCSCPGDCGAPPLFETGLCTDMFDNDCDAATDCADNDCSADPACQGGGAVCGDGICQSSSENCVSCPADCNGKQNGNPGQRFCCGNGGGQNPVTCADPRCTTGGFQCV